MMPGMDGYQVAARIKGNLATKNIPVIMVTALDDRDARMLGLSAGAEDFLTKPVDRAELCVRVRNLLRLKAYGDYTTSTARCSKARWARARPTWSRTRPREQAAVLTEQAALLDLAQDAIVVRDMHGRILFWSRGAEVMYGWLSDEALGRNTHELLKTEFSEPTEDIEADAAAPGPVGGRGDSPQTRRHALDRGQSLGLATRPDGAPVRILTINNDITDRKQAEPQRRKRWSRSARTRCGSKTNSCRMSLTSFARRSPPSSNSRRFSSADWPVS